MTFGMDVGWRRRPCASSACRGALGPGPGLRHRRPLPRAARNGYRAVGFDFSTGCSGHDDRVPLVEADVLPLPVADAGADGVTCGFALRNVVSLRAFFGELGRVVRPGGASRCSTRASRTTRCCARATASTSTRVPMIGGPLRPDAYAYLPKSMAYLPPPAEMLAMLRAAGFPDADAASSRVGSRSCWWAPGHDDRCASRAPTDGGPLRPPRRVRGAPRVLHGARGPGVADLSPPLGVGARGRCDLRGLAVAVVPTALTSARLSGCRRVRPRRRRDPVRQEGSPCHPCGSRPSVGGRGRAHLAGVIARAKHVDDVGDASTPTRPRRGINATRRVPRLRGTTVPSADLRAERGRRRDGIHGGELAKVVLARTFVVEAGGCSTRRLAHRLRAVEPHGYTSPCRRNGGSDLVGACRNSCWSGEARRSVRTPSRVPLRARATPTRTERTPRRSGRRQGS